MEKYRFPEIYLQNEDYYFACLSRTNYILYIYVNLDTPLPPNPPPPPSQSSDWLYVCQPAPYLTDDWMQEMRRTTHPASCPIPTCWHSPALSRTTHWSEAPFLVSKQSFPLCGWMLSRTWVSRRHFLPDDISLFPHAWKLFSFSSRQNY